MTKPQAIGDLNGKWSLLFKATLTLAPFLASAFLSFGVWATTQIVSLREWRSEVASTLWTHRDHDKYAQEVFAALNQKANRHDVPDPWLKLNVTELKAAVVENARLIAKVDKQLAVLNAVFSTGKPNLEIERDHNKD